MTGLQKPTAPTDLTPVLVDLTTALAQLAALGVDLTAVLAAIAAVQADVGDPSAAGTDLDQILRTGYNSAGIVPNENGSIHEILKYITSSIIPDISGLVYSGTCDATMVASNITIVSANLAGKQNDSFDNKYYMYIIRNANAAGVAPESERRLVTNYVSATGTFTTDPFTANVEANDIIMIVHEILVDTNDQTQATMDMVNGEDELGETNGDVTMDGTEQNIWIEESPQGVMEPLTLFIDVDAMADGDRIIIREKYREEKGEAYQQLHEYTLEGADGGLEDDNKKFEVDLKPNRHGYCVTAEQDLGTYRNLPWEVFVKR